MNLREKEATQSTEPLYVQDVQDRVLVCPRAGRAGECSIWSCVTMRGVATAAMCSAPRGCAMRVRVACRPKASRGVRSGKVRARLAALGCNDAHNRE